MGSFFYRGAELAVMESVYYPAEDSLLLADNSSFPRGASVLDMGCGCGIQAVNAAMQGAFVLAVDINERAVENTALNAELLGLKQRIAVRKSNLFGNIAQKFDFITFNPPYVPGSSMELRDVDGGAGGREVIDLFLDEMPRHLEEGGSCFLLQSSLNSEKETEKKARAAGLDAAVIARKKLFFEELLVFKFSSLLNK